MLPQKPLPLHFTWGSIGVGAIGVLASVPDWSTIFPHSPSTATTLNTLSRILILSGLYGTAGGHSIFQSSSQAAATDAHIFGSPQPNVK